MGTDVEQVIDRIQMILEKERHEKVYIKDVATALGISSSQLSNYKSRNSIPYDKVAEYCARNRISINWVLYGQSVEMLNTESESIYKIKLIKNVYSSAGAGAHNEDNDDVNYISIDPLFIDMLNITNQDNIEAIRVTGDSMEPTIKEEAIILTDRGKKQLTSSGIFVLNTTSGVIVKRISLNPNGHINLISDNKIYPVQTVSPDEVTVIGKVVGALERI